MADVIILVNLFIFINDIQCNGLFLNQKLWVLMLEEWRKILVLPLRCLLRINERLFIHHLKLIVSMVGGEVRVRHELWVQVELMG